MSCGVGHRLGSDPALLWLCHRLAATAPIRPLTWEPPYAAGVALKKVSRSSERAVLRAALALAQRSARFGLSLLCGTSWVCESWGSTRVKGEGEKPEKGLCRPRLSDSSAFKTSRGSPLVLQRKRIQLPSMRLWVRSLTQWVMDSALP